MKMLKTAVVMPMPRAKARMASAETNRDRTAARAAASDVEEDSEHGLLRPDDLDGMDASRVGDGPGTGLLAAVPEPASAGFRR